MSLRAAATTCPQTGNGCCTSAIDHCPSRRGAAKEAGEGTRLSRGLVVLLYVVVLAIIGAAAEWVGGLLSIASAILDRIVGAAMTCEN